MSKYARGAKERQYISTVLSTRVRQVIERGGLDLGSDPVLVSFVIQLPLLPQDVRLTSLGRKADLSGDD